VGGAVVSTWQAIRATHAERETSAALAQVTAAQAQTRDALDALTGDIVTTVFATHPELDETEKVFLGKVLAFYQSFTEDTAQTAQARYLRAKGYYQVALLRTLLGKQEEAAKGYRQAESLLAELARDFPDTADYRQKLARTKVQLGKALVKLGKETEAE